VPGVRTINQNIGDIMAAFVQEHIKQLRNANRLDMNAPIIMKGIKGIDYILVEVVAAAADSVAIGDLVYWSTFPTTVTVGTDNVAPCGIVPNTVKNLKAIAKHNSGTAITKELYFDAGYFEIALVIKSMIVEGKFKASNAVVANENLMAGLTGGFLPSDDTSPTCGVSLHNNDGGTEVSSGPVIFCPAYGLATKT